MNDEVLFYIDEINIRSIVRDLLHNWWMFILVGLSALLLLSSFEDLFYKERYTSSATMVISAKGRGTVDAYADLTTASEMADVFSDIFSSNVLKELVAEKLDIEMNRFSISASIIPETNLLVVEVSGDQPKIVYQAINEAIAHYAEVSEYVFSNAVLDVLQSPKVNAYPSNTLAIGRYKKLGVLAAMVLMATVISGLNILRCTVKTESAAKRRIKGKKLALIGHEEKNRTLKEKMTSLKKAILITNSTTSFGYVESFRKLAFRIHSEMKKKNQKVLLVTSISENEGKSTVASNIALALAQSGKKVVLVDLDLRKPAIHKIFNAKGKKQRGMWKEIYPINNVESISLILNKKSIEHPIIFMKESNIDRVIAQERERADYIIIDSSPLNVGADTELMLSYADSVALVVRQDWSYVQDIHRFINLLSKQDKDFMGYVLNDFENPNPFKKKQYDYDYGKSYGKYGYGKYHA